MNWIYAILTWLTDNHGYETQPQRRFKVGDVTTISRFIEKNHPLSSGDVVYIEETGRNDYLIRDKYGNKHVVYQHELDWDNRVIRRIDKEEKESMKWMELT